MRREGSAFDGKRIEKQNRTESRAVQSGHTPIDPCVAIGPLINGAAFTNCVRVVGNPDTIRMRRLPREERHPRSFTISCCSRSVYNTNK